MLLKGFSGFWAEWHSSKIDMCFEVQFWGCEIFLWLERSFDSEDMHYLLKSTLFLQENPSQSVGTRHVRIMGDVASARDGSHYRKARCFGGKATSPFGRIYYSYIYVVTYTAVLIIQRRNGFEKFSAKLSEDLIINFSNSMCEWIADLVSYALTVYTRSSASTLRE